MSSAALQLAVLLYGTLYLSAPFVTSALEPRTSELDAGSLGAVHHSQAFPVSQEQEKTMQLLVILAAGAEPLAQRGLAKLGHVVQAVSERVLVVEFLTERAAESASRVEGVQFIGSDPPPPHFPDTLSEEERLFVRAWFSGGGSKKERRGKGFEWDDPRMTPPDPPSDH